LREREADAQAANRAKSAFLATMSHEVRTPLIGVLGMLELLSLGQLDPEQRRAVNVIHQSAQNLLQILGGILDFSRIEAGVLELAPEPMDLRRLVEELAFVFSRAAGSKGLAFTCRVDTEVGAAHEADSLRLRQVLTNLLNNAVKFTNEGSVEFHVSVAGTREGFQALVFQVRDSGIGVSQEQRQRLFQPFAQVEASTTRRFGGTGLGLAICRRIAEAMGGELSMESALGRGTTMAFKVELPLADPAAIQPKEGLDPEPAPPRAAPTVEEAVQEGRLILLAEDHPTNRLVLQHQIRRAGYASEVASDGEQALGRWASGRYGMVLTDIHMPGLDGYELTAAIRDLERAMGRPRTPILAITANVLQGEAERCLDAGMDDYLSKPVTIPQLSQKLGQWLPLPAAPVAPTELERSGPREVSMEILLDLANGDASAARDILAEFLEAAREDLGGMDRAFAGRVGRELSRHAHRLKGAAAMVGAIPLAKVAAELEASSRNQDWLRVEPLLAQVHQAATELDHFARGQGG
ncbi:MAG TPA: ATP-binding protein, partial [Holophagaceae bacterium]|nr:ATP-binding protein [Holophagaceae bacterium]